MGDDVTTLGRVPGFRPYWAAATVSSLRAALRAHPPCQHGSVPVVESRRIVPVEG
jgi:hypothetical protein